MTEEERRLQQQAQQTTQAPAAQPQTGAAPTQQTQQTTAAPAAQTPAQHTQQTTQAQQTADSAYNQAMNALNAASKPTYKASYDAQIQDIYGQIMGRDPFQYDINEDALYQMYRQNYADLGELSMRDTMGQAAALTGGYGSSYGQAVGQQAYDSYLQRLNEVVPELQAQAYQRYQDEGDRLVQQYGLLGDLAADEYAKYQDEYNRYFTEQEYNYARLMDLINATGYTPSAEEAAAAGLTEDQVAAMLKAWKIQNPGFYNQMYGAPATPAAGGYGGSGSTGGSYDPEVLALQQALNAKGYNVAEDGIWGNETSGAVSALSPYYDSALAIQRDRGTQAVADFLDRAVISKQLSEEDERLVVAAINSRK